MKIFTTALALAAQWAQYHTPGIPRTADGKPDLSGLWSLVSAEL